MNITNAAAQIEKTLGAWRFRIGRDNEEAVESVDGFSLTWRIELLTPTESVEPTEQWTFTFSIRRQGKWFKTTAVVTPVDDTDIEVGEEIVYTEDQVKAAGFDLLDGMMRVAFPEVEE